MEVMEISPEESDRQLSVLTRLRTNQHRFLIESGIARRVLDAEIEANSGKDSSEFTEATLLFPIRHSLSSIPIGRLVGVDSSLVGCISKNNNPILTNSIAGAFNFFDRHPDAYEICIHRVDAIKHGFKINGLTLGIQLDKNDPGQRNIALDGIEKSDIYEVLGLLKEVESYKSSGELSCLDGEKLVNVHIDRDGPTPMP
jgi:hypothetical protein